MAPGGGNRLTIELIRKRAEHNEGVVSTLEEVSLHQEELVAIDEVLGRCCRKLKILYLQNNIISRLENLHHLKDLEYLNVALNNIEKIEGLEGCEFLNKLDMTVNFVDVDVLEESIRHLASRTHLKELFMMGNPAQTEWPGFANFVIASLPRLESLDGLKITKSSRIVAEQQLPHLRLELRDLAARKRKEKAERGPVEVPDTDEATPYTPEVRTAMYAEIAEQKAEAEERKAHLRPRERDAHKEQREAVAVENEVRLKGGDVRQCNQGKLDFFFDETRHDVVLDVAVPRHLDSSLIDLDLHPTYVSIVIKSKTLRLKLPVEVKSEQATAKRSKTTGHLVVTMPKLDENALFHFPVKQIKKDDKKNANEGAAAAAADDSDRAGDRKNSNCSRRSFKPKQPTIGALLLQEATNTTGAAS